jgi:hypothetical protein
VFAGPFRNGSKPAEKRQWRFGVSDLLRLILILIKFVVRIQPNHKKNLIEEETMHAAMLVTAELKLPSLAISELAFEAKPFRFGGFVPIVFVATKSILVAGSHLLPGKFADVLQPVEQLAEVRRVFVAELKFAMVRLEVLE